jgi:hypothetical protein
MAGRLIASLDILQDDSGVCGIGYLVRTGACRCRSVFALSTLFSA